MLPSDFIQSFFNQKKVQQINRLSATRSGGKGLVINLFQCLRKFYFPFENQFRFTTCQMHCFSTLNVHEKCLKYCVVILSLYFVLSFYFQKERAAGVDICRNFMQCDKTDCTIVNIEIPLTVIYHIQ